MDTSLDLLFLFTSIYLMQGHKSLQNYWTINPIIFIKNKKMHLRIKTSDCNSIWNKINHKKKAFLAT